MHLQPLLLAIIASAGLGALIGLIRQWSEQSRLAPDDSFAGVRTFAFLGLIGCVAAFLSENYSPAILPVAIAAVGLHLGFQLLSRKENEPRAGSTTFAITVLTMLVGALVQWEHAKEAVVIVGLSVVLIGMKETIHAWTRAFTPEDIHATLQFVAITGVILPLVPDRTYGPFDAFNPYNTWMMVVLISGLGFFGYLMMRIMSARSGLLLTSLFGGLASSTAMTLAFSRQSRQMPTLSLNYAMGVALACTVMLPRTLLAIGFVNPRLAFSLILPLAAMSVPALAYSAWVWMRQRRSKSEAAPESVNNPLSLKTSISFALLYAGIGFLVKLGAHFEFLQSGLLPISFVSGLTDMAAISLSLAQNQMDNIVPLTLAGQAVLLAAVSNSILKAGLAASMGSPVLRRHVVILLGFTALIGFAGMFWLSSQAAVTQ